MNDDLQQIYQGLVCPDEGRAVEIFRRMRAGQKPEAILRQMRHSSPYDPIASSYERRLYQNFLIALTQSTAPLRDIVDLSISVLNNQTRINLPQEHAYQRLKDRIITLETLSGILNSELYPRARPSRNRRY